MTHIRNKQGNLTIGKPMVEAIDAQMYLVGIGKVPQTVGGTVIICPCCGEYGLALMKPDTWVHNCGVVMNTDDLVEILEVAATG